MNADGSVNSFTDMRGDDINLCLNVQNNCSDNTSCANTSITMSRSRRGRSSEVSTRTTPACTGYPPG